MSKPKKPAPGSGNRKKPESQAKDQSSPKPADRRFAILAQQIEDLREIVDQDRAAIRRALPHVMWDR